MCSLRFSRRKHSLTSWIVKEATATSEGISLICWQCANVLLVFGVLFISGEDEGHGGDGCDVVGLDEVREGFGGGLGGWDDVDGCSDADGCDDGRGCDGGGRWTSGVSANFRSSVLGVVLVWPPVGGFVGRGMGGRPFLGVDSFLSSLSSGIGGAGLGIGGRG